MKPQISLKLIFSFSFSCQVSHNSGKEAGWRGLCWTHFLVQRGEKRRALWPGFNRLLHFFAQQNTQTAAHMLSITGVYSTISFEELTAFKPPEQENALSQYEGENTGVYDTQICLKSLVKWSIKSFTAEPQLRAKTAAFKCLNEDHLSNSGELSPTLRFYFCRKKVILAAVINN